jgi:hypothetical protein
MGMGWHRQGIMFNFMHTSESGWGGFIGGAFDTRDTADYPTEAYFPWINYSQKDWMSKNAYHAGVAYQINTNIRIGLGMGRQNTEYYKWGYGETGTPFRAYTFSDTRTGPVGMLEYTTDSGMGVQIIGGNDSLGAAFAIKF